MHFPAPQTPRRSFLSDRRPDPGHSIAAVARTVGLTRKTIYRALGRELVGS